MVLESSNTTAALIPGKKAVSFGKITGMDFSLLISQGYLNAIDLDERIIAEFDDFSGIKEFDVPRIILEIGRGDNAVVPSQYLTF